MAKKYHAQLLTPEGSSFEGEVISVRVPGTKGDFQMLHNHAPIVSSLGIGKISIKQEEGAQDIDYAVSGGFIEMSHNELTILAEKAEKSTDIDIEEAISRRDKVREKLDAQEYHREEIETELAVAENRLKIAES